MPRHVGVWVVLWAAIGPGCDYVREVASPTTDRASPVATGHDTTRHSHEDFVELTQSEREIAGIEVEAVELRESRSLLGTMAKVLAPRPRTAIVSHAFPGRVSEILVCVGDWVEKGQPVLVLESQAVGQARSEFYKAVADLELAEFNAERERRLMEQGIGVNRNVVAAEAALKIAQSTKEACEKSLHVLGFTEQQVEEMAQTHQINPSIQLEAPIAGRVVDIDVVVGTPIDETSEMLTIVDTRLLWIDAEVYEKDIAKIAIGQRTEITVPAFVDQVFRGNVTYIGDRFDDATRTITVRCEVDNADGRLKPGMFAHVDILLNGTTQALTVRKDAILRERDAEIVFVLDGEGYRMRTVHTGPFDGQYVTITQGLSEGERVVVEGNYQLRSLLLHDRLQADHAH